MKKQLVIVDDHELVAKGVSKFFDNHEQFEVGSIINDPKEALQKLPILKPEIVLMDLDMPGMSGLELISRLKKEMPETSFVILSMHLDKNTVSKALEIGASGYVSKNSKEGEFVVCVETVAKGQNYFSQEALTALSQTSNNLSKTSFSKIASLTPREIEVLKLVADGLSNKEIGEELHIAVRTVETHRKTIMEKLEVNKVAGLVRIAVQEGLV
ncbi:MAG: DNA-binding response regulator [Flammeovirgaceae bacterium]|nr:DNA-binding response regulator [Flammeovirgaceae bacterium]MBR09537.1 DNA-binding response regulator [Rickettsiales bacterium]HCX24942.1 DNA-binding response regulator [Cytophagales bacterium]|tara:strand:- start:1254 stop:1892 length:639 start_codon:yes stop_codon:yes gene_type:complete